MATSTGSRDASMEMRVNDYLDDKLQTAEDIDNVDALLERVLAQQGLLTSQLEKAKAALSDAQRVSETHSAKVLQRSKDFRQRQTEIDRQLQVLTQSNTSDEAVQKFEMSMSKLRRLEVATGYMEILQEMEVLGADARRSLNSNPRSSLKPYVRQRNLVGALKAAQPAAEGAAPHLADQVEKQANALYLDLRNSFENNFQKTLDKMTWPKKDLRLSNSIMNTWTEQVETLLDLQQPDVIFNEGSKQSSADTDPPLLLPLELMVQPLALRFRYHFYGDKPTNRLDKPEYFLSHILDLLDQYSGFMSQFLQPILDRRSRTFGDEDPIYTDALSSFITALLPMVTAKSLSLLPQISSQPQLLSHFIHELMSFDSTLRDSWGYEPAPHSISEWKGLTWTMLATHEYFDTWIVAEKQFALSRYESIRDAPDSGEFDYDSTAAGSTKPTKGAIRVNDLLETVTDRYRTLISFSQKLRFLIDIQLAIFDDYHGYLHGALQTYLASTHTAGRFIQGQVTVDKGLESLSKIFGSAEYLERKMSDWSDDVFFLELWDELQVRARRNSRLTGSVGRDMTMNEIATKTSASIAANGNGMPSETDGGALFDETAETYRRLRERTESEIVRALDTTIRSSMKPFTKMSGWASLSNASPNPSLLSPSATLDGTIQMFSLLFGFLSSVLASAPLRRIVRQACQAIQKEVWDNILSVGANSFSVSGVAQLRRDVSAIEDVIDQSVKSPGEASRSMRKLEEALTLLALPIQPLDQGRSAQNEDEEGWGFDEGSDNGVDGEADADAPGSDEDKVWGLWEANKRLFKSNASAREMLAEMGLMLLTESEARNIIERRVEINS